MFYRTLSGALALAAVALLVSAGFLYFNTPPKAPRFVVEEPDRVLSNLIVGHEYDLEFRVHNQTDQEIRVVGNEFS